MKALVSVLALGLTLAAPANAQLNLNTVTSSTDPITGLNAVKWIQLMTAEIDGKAVVGKPLIYLLNGTGQELNSVICDGKWQLVGPKPYIAGAPATAKPWKATIIPTEGFDGYCKKSITAQSDTGTVYKADLVSADGTFSQATFLTFMPQ